MDAAPVIMAAMILFDYWESSTKGWHGSTHAELAESAADAAEKLADEFYFETEAE